MRDHLPVTVLSGLGMDEAALRGTLDDALVPEAGFVPTAWAAMPDPFPSWRREAG